ncbi:hypothetical protein RRF57_013040 [Xylaria bambusicola]|uniref:Uncharacterized protein n=1 Tax=Xylaria bambusicola TaxID=326684 RepID=A0AAN7ZF87_9PEZI
MDSFPQSEIEYQTAHFNEDNGTAIAVVGSVFVALAIVSVALRVVARRVKGVKLASDDYLAIGTVVSSPRAWTRTPPPADCLADCDFRYLCLC